MAVASYPWIIRIFHTVFACCMLVQLAVGEIMHVPEAEEHDEAMHWITPALAHENEGVQTGVSSLSFEIHEFLGLVIAGLVLFRIALAFTHIPAAGWRELFPWLSADGRARLVRELSAQVGCWVRLELARPEDSVATAKTAHGILLLLASIMAVTGLVLYAGWSTTEPQSWLVALVAELHEVAAGVLEAVIGLHVLAAILHERQGHAVLARIRPSKPSGPVQ